MSSFASRFKEGLDIGRSLISIYETSKRNREIGDIASAQEAPDFKPEERAAMEAKANAVDANGQPIYTMGTDAQGGVTSTLNQSAVPGAADEAYAPAAMARSGVNFLGKSYGAPLTESQRMGAQQQAMAGVLDKNGDIEGAMRYRQQAKQGELTDLQMAQAKRTGALSEQTLNDDQALRKAMMSGIPADVQTQMDAGAGAGAGEAGGPTANGPVPTSQPLTVKNLQSQQNDLQAYLKNASPQVVKTLLSQGKLDEAKRYVDFMDSEKGKSYATAWATGLRKHAFGDHQGAVKAFEALYNNQLFDDGQTVKISPLEGGQQYQVELFDPQGKNIGTQTLDPKTLASQAALMLDPQKAVEFHAQQSGKREAEAATLDGQLQLENLKQEGAVMREDRRDDRLVTRLKAQADKPGKELTTAQQRANFEIDAAREQVAALSPAEIRRRTAKTTDTGRENPDFDSTLARASTLASRRKLGEDQDFDSRQRGSAQPAAPAVDRQEVAKRFRGDSKMNSYRLGSDTPKGVEVLDKAGKVVGHYQ